MLDYTRTTRENGDQNVKVEADKVNAQLARLEAEEDKLKGVKKRYGTLAAPQAQRLARLQAEIAELQEQLTAVGNNLRVLKGWSTSPIFRTFAPPL